MNEIQTNLENSEDRQFLVFSAGQETFGIDLLHVREILEPRNMSAVPLTPQFVRGILNLRGEVIPVIDLSQRFWNRPPDSRRRPVIIIIEEASESGPIALGLYVEGVNEVLTIHPSKIEAAPSFGASVRTDFIEGLAPTIEGHFLIILKLASVLDMNELSEWMVKETENASA